VGEEGRGDWVLALVLVGGWVFVVGSRVGVLGCVCVCVVVLVGVNGKIGIPTCVPVLAGVFDLEVEG